MSHCHAGAKLVDNRNGPGATGTAGCRLRALTLVCLVLGGCVQTHYRYDAPCPPPGQAGGRTLVPAAEFTEVAAPPPDRYRPGLKHNVAARLVRKMRNTRLDGYQVHYLQGPSSGNNGQTGNLVRLRYYRGDAPEAAPLVVILPIWGTFEYPSEKLAMRLRAHYGGSVHLAVVGGEHRLVNWPGIAGAQSREELLARATQSAGHVGATAEDIRRLLQWARARPEIDPERLALVGFSISAIVGSIAAVQEPELAATVLVMGAAEPAEVMSTCNRIAGRSRDLAMERLAMTPEQYRHIMHQAFDPLDWVKQGVTVADGSRFLVLDAVKDDCMPLRARESLWQGLGRPERYALRGSHHGAFISMTRIGLNQSNRLIVKYLDPRLQTPAADACRT
jgi:hypothetical protein